MKRPMWRRGWATLVLLCGLATFAAQASMREIKPDEAVALKPGEGLVVMAVDTSVDVAMVRMNRDGKLFGSGVMRDLKAGRNFRLYAVAAGTYEWRELQLFFGYSYRLSDDEDFRFTVEPGRITYPGDLLFRPRSFWRAHFASANRALAAIDWMQKTHPRVYAQYPFAFSGRYPDPFPAFYKPLRAAAKEDPAALPDLREPKLAYVLPLQPALLFKPERIIQASLNPSGTLLALQVRNGKDDWGVDLVDLQGRQASLMAKSVVQFDSVEWAGDDLLLLTVDPPRGEQRVIAVRVETDPAGARRYTRIDLPKGGWVVDTLPREPGYILFGSIARQGGLMVHRLDISSQKAVDEAKLQYRDRLNQGVKDDLWWMADGNGALRLAIARRGEDFVLVLQENLVFRDVMTLGSDTDLDPVGLSLDVRTMYALTDAGRGQRELVEYDLGRKAVGRTLFSRPGVDVEHVLFDAQRTPIGVQFYEGGLLVSEYFQPEDARLGALLAKAFPGRMVRVADRSRDGRHVVLDVDAADHPSQLYHLDTVKGTAELLDDAAPWLASVNFAPAQVLSFKGKDGLPLEAFLTLPAGAGKRPLVVFPHGGPIGVADRLHFDREVQFVASLGYAVLQVNFRGSDGYGRAFREAAYGAFGTRIEDDIDAAIAAALARHPVDGDRMCMLGASYGGYSGLVAAVRWPERFRCVVSIAGPSDQALLFTSSDLGRTEASRATLEKYLGDPAKVLDSMQQQSPLYQYAAIRTPVMLIHGLEDERVDYEHSRRMARMLVLSGQRPVGLAFESEGHSFKSQENREKTWSAVAGFLRQHLDGDTPAAAATSAATAGEAVVVP